MYVATLPFFPLEKQVYDINEIKADAQVMMQLYPEIYSCIGCNACTNGCSQGLDVSNRFIAMPSFRTRVMGLQLYMHDMDGFLQWGFNFYFSRHSEFPIDPYQITDGNHAWPSGDPFTVYPYENGAIESLRAVAFYEGLQDRMLLKTLEGKIGKEAVRAMVTEVAGCEVAFNQCLDAKILTTIHDKALELLA